MNRRPAFTLIELLVVVSIIALLVAILLPSLNNAMIKSRRTVSATNISGLAKALQVFAANNNDYYPGVNASTRYGGVARKADAASITFGTGLISADDRKNITDTSSTSVSVTRGFWLMIRDNSAQAKQFINPNQSGAAVDPTTSASSYYDFTSGDNVSYAYQMPYGNKTARPSSSMAAGVFVLGDRGPLYRDGDGGLDEGKLTSNVADSIPDSTVTIESLDSATPPNFEAEKWNSPNERYQGQNLGRADGGTEFKDRTTVGVDSDNVYTYADGDNTTNYLRGTATSDIKTASGTDAQPRTGTDTFLVP